MADNKLKGLSARAVFVIDRSGEIVYKEIVK
jgi:thiol peroxidase